MEIRNPTPFAVAQTVLLDRDGAEQLLVAVKAAYAISLRGELSVADEQDPIHPADQYHGEPDDSSIAQEAELAPPKPATDAFLVGRAHAPRPGTTSMQVCFRVGPREKVAAVHGARFWANSMGSAVATPPAPFETIPLIWENAYGGQDLTPEDPRHFGGEARNPVGRGFRARNSRAPWEGVPLPNILAPGEQYTQIGQAATPVGFGPIGRHWHPRITYAGTYDDAWMQQRMPLLPLDFDDRFHHAAPPDLVMPGFLGPGEWVDVEGCTPGGRVFFQLPAYQPVATVQVHGRTQDLPLPCNTVTVDTDRMRLLLLWKGTLRVHREVLKLKRTTISAPAGP
jgi:hypothetical protein